MRLLLLIGIVLFAARIAAQNNVSLTSTNGMPFKVIRNGKVLNDQYQAHLLMEGIAEDTLRAELEFENKKKIPVVIYLLEQGVPCRNKELNYSFESDGVRLSLRFTGSYEITRLPKPLVPVKPVVDTAKPHSKVPDHFCELRDGKPVYFNNLPRSGSCKNSMPADYLEFTLFLISRVEVEDQKFGIIENVCRNNCISVKQLGTLLGQISYEIEKLKMIRIAYPNLVDEANKRELEKSFRFDASIKELNDIFRTAGDLKINKSNNCTKAASQMLVDNFAGRLAAYGNDAERFEVFKKGYADLCYSADQAAQILNKFIHDREKLEAAKLLYFNSVEKNRFMKVGEVFSYNQTISELKDFFDKQNQ